MEQTELVREARPQEAVAVLSDPSSGTVWRVPVGEATLEPVASLD